MSSSIEHTELLSTRLYETSASSTKREMPFAEPICILWRSLKEEGDQSGLSGWWMGVKLTITRYLLCISCNEAFQASIPHRHPLFPNSHPRPTLMPHSPQPRLAELFGKRERVCSRLFPSKCPTRAPPNVVFSDVFFVSRRQSDVRQRAGSETPTKPRVRWLKDVWTPQTLCIQPRIFVLTEWKRLCVEKNFVFT